MRGLVITAVALANTRITLAVRLGSSEKKRADVMHAWHKALLHQAVPLIEQ